MGQGEILRILERAPDQWFTVRQLGDISGLTYDTVNKLLRRMRRFNEVTWDQFLVRNRLVYHYRWKA